MGLAGEGKIDDSVWMVKTHFPERIGYEAFDVNKCIVIVRNPLDSIFSLFNMIGTTTHSESVIEEELEFITNKTDIYDKFIEQEITVWADFHTYWIESPYKVPTHFVKYEDLLENPEVALKELCKFLLNVDSLDNFKQLNTLIQETALS